MYRSLLGWSPIASKDLSFPTVDGTPLGAKDLARSLRTRYSDLIRSLI
jgi:hypothetical protein